MTRRSRRSAPADKAKRPRARKRSKPATPVKPDHCSGGAAGESLTGPPESDARNALDHAPVTVGTLLRPRSARVACRRAARVEATLGDDGQRQQVEEAGAPHVDESPSHGDVDADGATVVDPLALVEVPAERAETTAREGGGEGEEDPELEDVNGGGGGGDELEEAADVDKSAGDGDVVASACTMLPGVPVVTPTYARGVKSSGRAALSVLADKRHVRAGVDATQARERLAYKKAMSTKISRPNLAIPTPEEEVAEGMMLEEFHAERLLQLATSKCLNLDTDRRNGVVMITETSTLTYATYWRKFLFWAFTDWKSQDPRPKHPYVLGFTQIERFAHAIFDTGEGELETFGEISVSHTGIKTMRSAMNKLWLCFCLIEDETHKSWAQSTDSNLQQRVKDPQYALTLAEERRSLRISRLPFWGSLKASSVRYARSIAAGGKPKGQFGKTLELMRTISYEETDNLGVWMADARYESLQCMFAMQTLQAFCLFTEGFLARPQDVEELRYANIGLASLEGMSHATIGSNSKIVRTTVDKHKNSSETGKPVFRWAIRNVNVSRCPIFALMWTMFLNWHVAGVDPIDLHQRDSTHTRASKAKKKSDDVQVWKKHKNVPLIQWHNRRVFFNGRQSVDTDSSAMEPTAKKRASKAKQIDDAEPIDGKGIGDLLKLIRECTFVDEIEEGKLEEVHLLHRRGAAANRAIINGAPQSSVETLGGWGDTNNVAKTHYFIIPDAAALIAAAGGDGRRNIYYLEYSRDELQIPSTLQRLLFPWLESCKADLKKFHRDMSWPEGLRDDKAQPFFEFLEYARVTLWQDWAILFALDTLRNGVTEVESASSFWNLAIFVEAGEDWVQLREEAVKRVRDPESRIPKNILAKMKTEADYSELMQLDTYREVIQVKGVVSLMQRQLEELKESFAKNVAIMERLEQSYRQEVRTEPSTQAPTVPLNPPVPPVPSLDNVKYLGGYTAKKQMKNDFKRALSYWQRLAEHFDQPKLPPDVAAYLSEKRGREQLWWTAVERWADDHAGHARGAEARRQSALQRLADAAWKVDAEEGICAVFEEFEKKLKQGRKNLHKGPEMTRADSRTMRSMMDRFDELTGSPVAGGET